MINLSDRESLSLLNILRVYRWEYSKLSNMAPNPLCNDLLIEFFKYSTFDEDKYQKIRELVRAHDLQNVRLTNFEKNKVSALVENETNVYSPVFEISYNSEDYILHVFSTFKNDGTRVADDEEVLHNSYRFSLR